MSAARPDTWMPLYWGDYARDTGHLNALAHGAYLMLIKHYWCTGRPLTDDDSELWRIACCDSPAEWKRLRSKLEPFFQRRESRWHHQRIDDELAKAQRKIDAAVAAGKASAQRRANDRSTTVEPPLQPDTQRKPNSSPSPSPSDSSPSGELREARSQTRATRLPSDFVVSEDWKRDGAEARVRHDLPAIDLDLEAAKFPNYWTSQPDAKARKTNWHRTWINWCLKAEAPRNSRTTNEKPTPLESLYGAAALVLADREHQRSVNSGTDFHAAQPLLDSPGGPATEEGAVGGLAERSGGISSDVRRESLRGVEALELQAADASGHPKSGDPVSAGSSSTESIAEASSGPGRSEPAGPEHSAAGLGTHLLHETHQSGADIISASSGENAGMLRLPEGSSGPIESDRAGGVDVWELPGFLRRTA